jgi:hypothetical protein
MAERFSCSLYFVEAPRDVCLAFSILAQTASAYFLCWLIYLLPHTYFTMGFLTIFKSDDRVAIWAALSTSLLAFLQGLDGAEIAGFTAMEGFLEDFGYFDQKAQTWGIKPNVQLITTCL